MLLAPDEASAFQLEGDHRPASLLVCADHASNAVPRALGSLGLEAETFGLHVAYDIGALAVSRIVAERLNAPFAWHAYSRLALDPNRYAHDPSSIPLRSDGKLIPANQDLSEQERQERQEALLWGYQNPLGDKLAELDQRAGKPVPLISIHSFTPQLMDGGQPRPWHFGVLYDQDKRLAMLLHAELSKVSAAPVGDNLPYSAITPKVYTTDHHCERVNRPYVCIEVRQDLIAEAQGQKDYGGLLADCLVRVLEASSF